MKRASKVLCTAIAFGLFLILTGVGTMAQSQVPACLYALDGSASGALNISGNASVTTSCSIAVESSSSTAFELSGNEILYVQTNVQVGVVGGWSIGSQAVIENPSTRQTVSPVKISSPGDPLSFLPAPTSGTTISKTPVSYSSSNKPPNNTLSPGVYCGGLTIGNTNGATFTMSPGTYIMAGGGLAINSQAVVSGSGVTVYNTSSSSSSWGCSGSYSYTPINISGQASVTLSGPSSGALANVLFFGDRAGCSTAGSCEDQINGGSSTTFSGAMYFKTDTLLISGNNSSKGCMMAVADKITFNGNSSVINACSGTIGGVTVTVSPSTVPLYAGQTQQFSATVTNTGNTQVNWAISPAGVGTISSGGLYTAPSTITSTQTVTVTATSQAEPTVTGTAQITLALPPSIAASLSPSPNAAGWNNSTVTVNFTCTAGTYPVKTCPSPVQVTTQGANQQFCGQAVDTNGDKSAAACATVNLDEAPPTITATPTPAPDSQGWNNSNVTVNFTCSDSLSGISVCPSPVYVTSSGANQVIKGTATDKAGNTATATTTLNIELTLPSITASVSPTPNSSYWNNTSVTVSFACTPSVAPIDSCSSPQTVSTQGAGQVITGSVTDAASNTNTAKVTVNIATTPPQITASVSPAPNSAGWNDTPVTVTFTCTATTAPLAMCPQPKTVSTTGTNQAVSGTVTDLAGNTATASVKLNIATAPPTITAAVSPTPNSNGWNKSNVTVTFTCTATTAPIASCPSPQTVNTQGAGQIISGTVTDVAGNSASTSVTVNLELTPPTITAQISPTPNAQGWNNSPVTVSFVCSATISPITSCTSSEVISTGGAGQQVIGTTTDAAGNTASTTVTLNIATVPPAITGIITPAPNAAGWNNTNPTITWTCVAGTAPIAFCPSPQTISTQGGGQVFTGTVTDVAGNSNSAAITINLDKTPPTITATAAPAANAAGWNTTAVTVTFTCADSLSGIATCPSPAVVSTVGTSQSVSGTATDKAGNTATATATLNIELAGPSILASISPAPNANGWNNTNVTVSFTCTASTSPIISCPSPQTVSTEGANQIVSGTVTDAAGNTNTAKATVNIGKTAPKIAAAASPAPNTKGWNSTSVTVTFTCTAGTAPVSTCPAPQTVSTQGANQLISGTVTDAAGNTASTSLTLNISETPPTITASLSPAPNASGWNTTPVTVSFVCSDSLSGVATCPSPTTISTNGANQVVSGTATNVAGLSATTTATVNLEQSLPTITGSVSPAPNSAGWNNSSVTVSFLCHASASPITSCSPNQTVSTQGIGQVISGTVQDQAGNQATTSVALNIDITGPVISQFTAPSQLSPGQSGTASLTVADLAPIASVVFALNGSVVGTVLAPPYSTAVTIPSNATSGSTDTLSATVTDVAGNVSSANAGIQVVSAGVIVGTVLTDATGLPLQGANLQVVGQSGQTAASDGSGQYSIPVTNSQLFLDISMPGTSGGMPQMVQVERQVAVQSGVGTVPVDARMTALAAPVAITGSGGTVGTGAITVTVPAGGATTSYYLTPLSPQGLPNLLPLGWSPVAAFDLQTNVSTSAALSANFTGLPSGTLYLASYSYSVHAWSLITPNLTANNGSLTVALPSLGDYALVVPDPGVAIPSAGQPLTGVSMVPLPTNATGWGSLSPANVAPTGGTSVASLSVQASTVVPSGTVIQAQVKENYTLTSGQLLSEEPRYEDLLLYQNPAPPSGLPVGASFPVTPSQTFQPSQLVSGDVHLNILNGRESVRGQTGGSDPVSVQSGDATLTIAAGSLPQDTAIAVTPEAVDTFLPSTPTLVPVSEYNVNFSDQTLSNTAQLSVGTQGLAPGTNVVIAQENRVAGVPYLVVVSMATVTTTNIVSKPTTGLPGITQGGDYVIYELTVPTGFVSGTVSASSGPVAAMVQTDALPFVAFSGSNGTYDVVAAAGTVNLSASIANTALAGTSTAQVVSGQTATANISVTGQVEGATITPANGAVGIPLTPEIDITAPAGFNTASVNSSTVVLTAAGSSTPIALNFVFSAGNTKLAIFTQGALQPSTQYALQTSGLANSLGGLISVPNISFTTLSTSAPTYSLASLGFAMPDSNGNVAISAPAGSFPAGSTIQIIDQTNGVVYTLTVYNDGSVTGSMPATINDILQVTLTDPSGHVTTITVSQFVGSNGTTAIGPGGGTVTGPGGRGIIIPAGALAQGTTFQITPLDQTAFPVLPAWTGANFGSGMTITDPAMPTFKTPAKLAFPVPANAPSNAFYYVYRRLTDQNGNTYFETIDEAFVQGTGASAQVVTASPPFCGYHNSYAKFTIQSDGSPLPSTLANQDYFVMWDATGQQGPAGLASQGLIVGLATQTVPAVVGVSAATTQPAQGAVSVFLADANGNPLAYDATAGYTAIYDGTCATYTLFDPHLGGGTRNLIATQVLSSPSQTGNATTVTNTLKATADEVNGAQSDDGLYAIYAGLEDLYKNIGRVDFLFPPPTPAPPAPAVTIDLYTLNQNGHRVPASTILQTGSQIVIAFKSALTVTSATVGDTQLDIQIPDSTDAENTDNLPEQFLQNARAQGLYTVGPPGNYTITVTAIDPISLTLTTASQNILAVAASGGNTGTFTCTAAAPPADPTAGCTLPAVLTTFPQNNATAIDIGVFPEITFNEPVTNIPGNVSMTDSNGNQVPVVLVGVRVPNPNNPNQAPIADPIGPSDVITSMTLEPINGLDYGTTYSISLNATAPNACLDTQGNPQPQPTNTKLITDENIPPTGPFCLAPFPAAGQQYQFTTFAPSVLGLGNSPDPVLTREAVIGQYAYAGEYLNAAVSGLGIFNISNPIAPVGLVPTVSFVGRAIDVAGQANSPVTASGGGLVAISAGTAVDNDIPANVWLYDVSSPTQPQRVGAVSVTTDTNYGIALRLFMKDRYLYASTFEQGLQVIDLGQALSEYAQVYNSSPTDFGQAVSTPGSGFAMDAITNTIALPRVTGTPPTAAGSMTMFDIKADDFAATGGSSNTLMLATGQLPLVMADPTLSGLSAVLYPASSGGGFATSPVQPLLMTGSNGTTNYLLCYGQALDIGQIPVTNSSGTSSNEHIVVIVGNGLSGSGITSCPIPGQGPAMVPALAVVNVSALYYPGSSYAPQLVGWMQLPTTGTDVTLKGTTALVSTGSNILLVDVANPAQPALSGTITGNFGNWLALTPTGFVIGSASGGTAVQTAVTGQTIIPNCPTPILSIILSGAGSANPVYVVAQPVTCPIYTNTSVANVTVNFSTTNLGPLPASLNNGALQVTIPAGTQVTGAVMFAQATGVNTQTGATLTGPSVAIPIGPVHIVVDSNNDTVIDPVQDPAAAQSGKKFSFWQADPNNTGNGGLDSLEDFAPIRVYVNDVPAASTGSIQLALTSTAGNTASWVLTENLKVPPGSSDAYAAKNEKLYLTDQTTATSELANAVGPSVVCGAASGNSFANRLCASQGGLIELPGLTAGFMYDLLIACQTCAQDSTWSLQVLLVSPSGAKTVLDQVPVDIRPLQNWMTVETVRNGSSTKPLSYPILESGGWEDIPQSAQNLVLLVHGFSVTDSNATSSFLPQWFKRLYWTGHPVLLAQNNTHTVGLTWPGDPGSTDYPIAYMTAFETGIPLAKFLSDQSLLHGRKIEAMAHSLGNVVMNSAISRPEFTGAQLTSYVMNEAALPAEAFNANYQPDAADVAIYDSHAVDFGWSDNTAQTPLDQGWQTEWAGATSDELQQWVNTLSTSTYVTSPQPIYTLRWGQQRPAGGVPDNPPFNSTPQRGSWLGFFAGNLSKTNITDTYNTGDGTLLEIWGTMNLDQMPFVSILGFGSDDIDTQFWSTLNSTDGGQETVWGQACSSYSNCLHSNIIRQWAELSYWFPSRSSAAGAGPLSGINSLNFSQYAPPVPYACTLPYGPGCFVSILFTSGTHSYLHVSPYWTVFPAWQQIQGVLK